MCEVHLQYGNSTTKWPFCTFSSKFPSNIYSILYDDATLNLLQFSGSHFGKPHFSLPRVLQGHIP